MTSVLSRFDQWFHAPVPRQRLTLARFCVGAYALVYLVSRAGHLLAPLNYPDGAFAPVGIARLIEAPLAPGWLYVWYGVSVISGAAFTLGRHPRALGPVFALSLLWVLTYRHSWGMIFHTDNLLVLHVAVLALAPFAGAPAPAGLARDFDHESGWALRAMSLLTVASYFVAGVAKLSLAGTSWIDGSMLREQIAYDALRKLELGSIHSPLGPWLLPHVWLFPPLAIFSLGAELLAPLALLGRRAALVWCVSAWLFHVGVLALMAIAFPYPMSGVAFVSFAPLEQWWQRLRQLRTAAPAA